MGRGKTELTIVVITAREYTTLGCEEERVCFACSDLHHFFLVICIELRAGQAQDFLWGGDERRGR